MLFTCSYLCFRILADQTRRVSRCSGVFRREALFQLRKLYHPGLKTSNLGVAPAKPATGRDHRSPEKRQTGVLLVGGWAQKSTSQMSLYTNLSPLRRLASPPLPPF